jgi:hypothetical protein
VGERWGGGEWGVVGTRFEKNRTILFYIIFLFQKSWKRRKNKCKKMMYFYNGFKKGVLNPTFPTSPPESFRTPAPISIFHFAPIYAANKIEIKKKYKSIYTDRQTKTIWLDSQQRHFQDTTTI